MNHHMCNTKLYKTWQKMKDRCKPDYFQHYLYYDKGVRLYNEWQSFIPFMEWALANGYKDGLTIDRKDNNKGYNPENCRFATKIEQGRNRDACVYFEHNEEKHCLTEWCEILGVSVSTAFKRYHKGWNFEEIFSKPRNTNKVKLPLSELDNVKEMKKTMTLVQIAKVYNVCDHSVRMLLNGHRKH